MADLATPMAIRVAATLGLVELAGSAGATAEQLASKSGTAVPALQCLLGHLVTSTDTCSATSAPYGSVILKFTRPNHRPSVERAQRFSRPGTRPVATRRPHRAGDRQPRQCRRRAGPRTPQGRPRPGGPTTVLAARAMRTDHGLYMASPSRLCCWPGEAALEDGTAASGPYEALASRASASCALWCEHTCDRWCRGGSASAEVVDACARCYTAVTRHLSGEGSTITPYGHASRPGRA
jgi:hypothetical protein